MNNKPILCLDFDGVIHSYTSGWKGIDVIPDPPVDGAIEFLWTAIEHFKVCIFSSRSKTPEGIGAMRQWLGHWDKLYWASHPNRPQPRTALVFVVDFPTAKPSAFVTLDDRAITFNGNWPSIDELKNFTPWFVRPSEQKIAGHDGVGELVLSVAKFIEWLDSPVNINSSNTPMDVNVNLSTHLAAIRQAYQKIQQGSGANPSDIGNATTF